MKTIVMKMWLVVAAALTVTLTSCSDDDDNNKSGSGKITYFAEIEVSDDVLSLATVNLQEYGNSGLGAATQLTKTKYDWPKTITSYPAKVGLALSIEPKKNQELTKEKYDITVVYKVTMKDEKGNIKGAGVVFSKKSRVEAAGVSLVLENIKRQLTNQKALIDFNSASDFTPRSKSEF